MATHGKGVTFGIGDGGDPETFTSIGEITGLELPGLSRELVDVTHHASTAKEWLAQPLIEYGDAVITVNRNPGDATDAALDAAFASPDAANFQITIPAGAQTFTMVFPAVPTGLEKSSPMDAQQTATLTVKVTGAPTETLA